MDKARILQLCNQIEMIIVTVCNTGYTLQPGDEEAIFNRTKAIMDEVSAPPKTNADRIRQMTDAEIAKELTGLMINAIHSPAFFYGRVTEKLITTANLKWLQKEVSEDAGSKTD